MHCFIISPIGAIGSEVRKLADAVFVTVIEPALAMTNVTGHRADHINDVGRISEHMFNEILGSDFCIALLTGSNPNVFYEVAVAHSAGIPVILLTEPNIDPPFDLKDQRTLHYNLDPVAVFRGDNPRALAERIENVRKLKGTRRVPFGENLTPLNAQAVESGLKISPESMAAPPFWINLIERAQRRFYVSAFGLTGWKTFRNMRATLAATGPRGCEVRMMTMDETSSSFDAMVNPDILTSSIDGMRIAVGEARKWYADALAGNPLAEVRAIRNSMLHAQFIVSDDLLVWSPYMFSADPRNTPRIECGPDNPLFSATMQEFEALWEANDPAKASSLKSKPSKLKAKSAKKKARPRTVGR
jgi:hypothetical protein